MFIQIGFYIKYNHNRMSQSSLMFSKSKTICRSTKKLNIIYQQQQSDIYKEFQPKDIILKKGHYQSYGLLLISGKAAFLNHGDYLHTFEAGEFLNLVEFEYKIPNLKTIKALSNVTILLKKNINFSKILNYKEQAEKSMKIFKSLKPEILYEILYYLKTKKIIKNQKFVIQSKYNYFIKFGKLHVKSSFDDIVLLQFREGQILSYNTNVYYQSNHIFYLWYISRSLLQYILALQKFPINIILDQKQQLQNKIAQQNARIKQNIVLNTNQKNFEQIIPSHFRKDFKFKYEHNDRLSNQTHKRVMSLGTKPEKEIKKNFYLIKDINSRFLSKNQTENIILTKAFVQKNVSQSKERSYGVQKIYHSIFRNPSQQNALNKNSNFVKKKKLHKRANSNTYLVLKLNNLQCFQNNKR